MRKSKFIERSEIAKLVIISMFVAFFLAFLNISVSTLEWWVSAFILNAILLNINYKELWKIARGEVDGV